MQFFQIEKLLDKFYVWIFRKDRIFYSYFALSAMGKYLVESLHILSQTRRHYVTLLFIGWQVILCSWQAVLCSWQPLDEGATKYIFTVILKGKCYRCIRMVIPIFKIFIWGGISSDIRSEIFVLRRHVSGAAKRDYPLIARPKGVHYKHRPFVRG